MNRKPSATTVLPGELNLEEEFLPPLPAEVATRFPSMVEWMAAANLRWRKTVETLKRQRIEDAEALTKKFQETTPSA